MIDEKRKKQLTIKIEIPFNIRCPFSSFFAEKAILDFLNI